MTAKQELLAHLESQHSYHQWSKKAKHELLIKAHRQEHAEKHLTHEHRGTSPESYVVLIFLAPPKNPSSNSRPDRNWTLNIAHLSEGHGWHLDLPGTNISFPEEAKAAANKALGWTAMWQPKGWGFEVAA